MSDAKDAKTNGPDPAIGIGVGALGLLTMATGGAMTWHWVFIIGEGVMLLGAVMFLAAVAISAWRLDGRSLQERASEWLEGLPEPDEGDGGAAEG